MKVIYVICLCCCYPCVPVLCTAVVVCLCAAGRFILIHVLDIIKKGEIVGRGSLSSINEEQF